MDSQDFVSDDKLKDMMNKLGSPDLLFEEYVVAYSRRMERMLSTDEAYKTGESPEQGAIQEWMKSARMENKDEFIRMSPYFEIAEMDALVQLILNNNRRLLDMLKYLIGRYADGQKP